MCRDRRTQRRLRFVVVAVVGLGELLEALLDIIVEHRLLPLVAEFQLLAAESVGHKGAPKRPPEDARQEGRDDMDTKTHDANSRAGCRVDWRA